MAINGKRVSIVLPAYNAEKTLQVTLAEIPKDLKADIILVDDASSDNTVALAEKLKLHVIAHPQNQGYGANQKTCYQTALARGADIVIMLHPDYQYTPKLLRAMAAMIADGVYDVVLGSRILGKGALAGGMPLYKYVANRLLTFTENVLINQKLSEYHTGYRAFSRRVLEQVRFMDNDDGFVFDNQMLLQCYALDFRIGEISCPTHYFADASTIGLAASVNYGLGCLQTALAYKLHQSGLRKTSMFTARELSA